MDKGKMNVIQGVAAVIAAGGAWGFILEDGGGLAIAMMIGGGIVCLLCTLKGPA